MLPEIALPSACPVKVGVAQDSSMRNGKPAILRSGQDHARPSWASRAIHENRPRRQSATKRTTRNAAKPRNSTPITIVGSAIRSRLGGFEAGAR